MSDPSEPKPDKPPKPSDPLLTLENLNDFLIDDLSTDPEEKIWNRFVILKQAEINSMLRALPSVRKPKGPRIDSLCSAVDGGCDPVSE